MVLGGADGAKEIPRGPVVRPAVGIGGRLLYNRHGERALIARLREEATMSQWVRSIAVVLVLGWPLAAPAHFRSARAPAVTSYAYYYPVAAYAVPVPVAYVPPVAPV